MMLLLALTACNTDADPEAPPVAVVDISTARSTLRWKRNRALQNDLSRALALPLEEVCTEVDGSVCATVQRIRYLDWLASQGLDPQEALQECAAQQGTATCQDDIWIDLYSPLGAHTVSLGGNSPFLGEQYQPLAEPGLTTPMALDRMLLSACGERATRDLAGPIEVFEHVGLSAITSGSIEAEQTVSTLFRRLLARDPEAEEVATVTAIADTTPPMSGEQFA